MSSREEYNDFYNRVAKELRELLHELNIKHKTAAIDLGIPCGSFENKITNAGAKFNTLELLRLCDYLEISLEDLLRGEV